MTHPQLGLEKLVQNYWDAITSLRDTRRAYLTCLNRVEDCFMPMRNLRLGAENVTMRLGYSQEESCPQYCYERIVIDIIHRDPETQPDRGTLLVKENVAWELGYTAKVFEEPLHNILILLARHGREHFGDQYFLNKEKDNFREIALNEWMEEFLAKTSNKDRIPTRPATYSQGQRRDTQDSDRDRHRSQSHRGSPGSTGSTRLLTARR
jgi:hypothetical protein